MSCWDDSIEKEYFAQQNDPVVVDCECDGDCIEYEKDGVVISWRCEHCGKLHIVDSKGGKE